MSGVESFLRVVQLSIAQKTKVESGLVRVGTVLRVPTDITDTR
jgi:hypothetical protein